MASDVRDTGKSGEDEELGEPASADVLVASAEAGLPDPVIAEGAAPARRAEGRVALRAALLVHPGAGGGYGAEEVPLARVAALLATGEGHGEGEGAALAYVDLSGYAADDLRAAAAQLGLPRAAVRAALAPWRPPHLAIYPEHLFVGVTVPLLDPTAARVFAGELDLLVGPGMVLAAHRRPLPFAAPLDARLAQAAAYLRAIDDEGVEAGVDGEEKGEEKEDEADEEAARAEASDPRGRALFVVYLVLDELLAYYEGLAARIEEELEELEERALRAPPEDFLERLLRFKRYVFALYRLAEQHRAVLAVFTRPDFAWVASVEAREPFEDLEARLARLLETLGAAKEATNGAFDLYVSHMAHRTNQVIKVLTLASTLLFTASVVIALFGATVQGVATYGPLPFAAMLVVLAAVGALVVLLFRRRGWL